MFTSTLTWDQRDLCHSSSPKRCFFLDHRIHETGIFAYIWWAFMVNVGTIDHHGSYGLVGFFLAEPGGRYEFRS